MATKRIKPTTPGQRFKITTDYSELTKKKPERSLLGSIKQRAGRNNQGRITVPYRGGGHKKRPRLIDFMRKKFGVEGVVRSIEYDPMRSPFIALIYYKDGIKSYIVAPKGLKVGDTIVSGEKVAPEIGNAMPLGAMPLGTVVHNVQLDPNRPAALVRSAGNYAKIMAKEGKYVTIKLPSSEMRKVSALCMATVGEVSNGSHNQIIRGKAGARRWEGRRPRTRKVAMNPVDHPMGGGEGRASGGLPRSKNGIYAKGQVTRKRKKYSDHLIVSKRKK